jgi:transposase-like protein
MLSPFENDTAARELFERLRWPDGPECPRANCGAHGDEVFRIASEHQSHRDGLYHCRRCRTQFSVTAGTSFAHLRVPLHTWVQAARAFSFQEPKYIRRTEGDVKPTMQDIQFEIGVTYRTVLRMRDVIANAASKYRGHKYVFGAWPRSLMRHQREDHKKTLKSEGVLMGMMPPRALPMGILSRTERLLRLLLATPPMKATKRQTKKIKRNR